MIVQGVIASTSVAGGPPGPVQFDGGYYGDNNSWVMNGSMVGAGTQSNTTTSAYTYPDGVTGAVLNFDGTAVMYSPNLASIPNTWLDAQMSVDMWFYPTAAGVQLLCELGQPDVTTGFHYSMLEINADLTVKAKLWDGTPATSDTKVTLNQWNHVYFAQIWTGDHYFSVNGVNKNGVANYVRQKPPVGNEYFSIGGVSITNMGNSGSFQGKIGWLEIHDYVAASTFDSRVDKFMPAPLALSLDAGNANSYSVALPGFWSDTIQNNVFDLYGSTPPAYSASNGGFLQFNPADGNYAQGPSLSSAKRWTVETWHYYSGTNTGGNPCIVTEVFANSVINYLLGAADSSQLKAAFFSGGFGAAPSGTTLTPNTWYHIVGTFDGYNLYMYLNGTQVQSSVWPGATPTSSGSGIRLMRRWDQEDYWGGSLSIVRIYTGALNATSITSNFNAEKTRFGIT